MVVFANLFVPLECDLYHLRSKVENFTFTFGICKSMWHVRMECIYVLLDMIIMKFPFVSSITWNFVVYLDPSSLNSVIKLVC